MAVAGVPVTPGAVYGWLAGRASPRPYHAVTLVRLSRGTLALDDVYSHRLEVTPARDGGREGGRWVNSRSDSTRE